jgi:NAD(P)-dependent dehydrogenase (short-subunit alcohol dehydrogenase family)
MTQSSSNSSRRVAVVTGASRGIGLATARAFAAHGYDLVLNARAAPALEQAAHALRSGASRCRVEAVAGDTTDPAVRAALVARARDLGDRIDALVNNAGHFVSRPFEETAPTDLRRLLEVHVEAPFLLTQAALPLLRRARGAVVNVTTILTTRGIPRVPTAAQATAKGALEALTRNLAHELGRDGVRVSAVAPGTIRTAIFHLTDEQFDALGPMQPLGRVGEAVEVADAIVHLATAPFTTGVVLPVDGGALVGTL